MIPLWLIALALAAAAGGGGRPKGGSGGTVKGPRIPAVLDRPAVWSLGADWSSRCGGSLPVIPAATQEWGTVLRPDTGAPLSWGWTGPTQRASADALAGRLIADVETYVTAKGADRWTGAKSEIQAAQYLAARCPAVTSHGFVAPRLRDVLGVFAAAGCVGVPQVYDSDRSTAKDPEKFLRQCVDSYRRAGFKYVLPLLGLSAGLDIVNAWIAECKRIGVPYHLWSLQRLLEGGGAACALVTP